MIDFASWRRFDEIIDMPVPDAVAREQILRQNLNGAGPVNLSRIVEAGDRFSGASVESIAEDAVRLRILCQTPTVTDARLEAALAHERRRDLRPPMPAEAGLAPRDAQRPSLALCHKKPPRGRGRNAAKAR